MGSTWILFPYFTSGQACTLEIERLKWPHLRSALCYTHPLLTHNPPIFIYGGFHDGWYWNKDWIGPEHLDIYFLFCIILSPPLPNSPVSLLSSKLQIGKREPLSEISADLSLKASEVKPRHLYSSRTVGCPPLLYRYPGSIAGVNATGLGQFARTRSKKWKEKKVPTNS